MWKRMWLGVWIYLTTFAFDVEVGGKECPWFGCVRGRVRTSKCRRQGEESRSRSVSVSGHLYEPMVDNSVDGQGRGG